MQDYLLYGYDNYAIDAFKLHVSGYLTKPISKEAIQKEIDHILKGKHKSLLKVRCFGNFEVYYNDEILTFKRNKTKELLALLIDRKGAGLSAKELCTYLWESDDDNKNSNYLRQLVKDLKDCLTEHDIAEIFIHEGINYAIKVELIDCDYYNYLKNGKPEFKGEYMLQYSWAEETCALLYKFKP